MPIKLTMKEPYGKTKFLSVRFRGYFDLIRPFTLAAPLFVSMFIMFASLVYNDRFAEFPDWWITIGQASLTLTFLNAASNALNQATDFEGDPRIFSGDGKGVYLIGSPPQPAVVDMGVDEYCLLKRQGLK